VVKNALAGIKDDVDSFVGKRVLLRANRGRKKVMEKIGIVEKTYPNIFIIKLEDQQQNVQRISFSYTDILTDVVKLSPCNEDLQEIKEQFDHEETGA